MKSFINVHVIFNFAIGKINLVTRYILNGQREALLSFHPQSAFGRTDDILYINPKFVFPVFLFPPSLQVVVLLLASLHNFYECNKDCWKKQAQERPWTSWWRPASPHVLVHTARGQCWLRKAM